MAGFTSHCGHVVLSPLCGLTSGAVRSDPPGEALAGAVDGVTRPVVGAEADLRTHSAVPARGTHWGQTQPAAISKGCISVGVWL